MADINKINSSNPYLVDGRAMLGVPLRPSGVYVADGSNVIFTSGIRVNADEDIIVIGN